MWTVTSISEYLTIFVITTPRLHEIQSWSRYNETVRYSEIDVTVQIIMEIGVIGILQDEVLKMEYN